jgi:hypothetical protein
VFGFAGEELGVGPCACVKVVGASVLDCRCGPHLCTVLAAPVCCRRLPSPVLQEHQVELPLNLRTLTDVCGTSQGAAQSARGVVQLEGKPPGLCAPAA